ncbi:MAG: enoyl-CoA hydratase/isomerase family protein [Rhodobacter sp.]|nr:enoyl-CoA hydratase/isomerase family protein [Paracoccaceae bacterium]MCC0077517.1 enoyl-CoA hydratase/isomerase family protein [Rhodobacter sp.]
MSLVTLSQQDGVARLTLARAGRANALTAELLEDLHAALDRLGNPRALVLAGEGRNFCTGGDVARFADEVAAGNGPAYAAGIVGALNRAILRLAALRFPVIARVQGALTGGALGLVLAADLVVMTPEAFVQPFYAVVGFAPDGGWTRMLADRIGAHRVRAIHLLNQRITALDAQSLGLAQAVSAQPDAVIAQWLATLASHDPGSIAATKRLLSDDLERTLEAERTAFVAAVDRAETRAGMARFLTPGRG